MIDAYECRAAAVYNNPHMNDGYNLIQYHLLVNLIVLMITAILRIFSIYGFIIFTDLVL